MHSPTMPVFDFAVLPDRSSVLVRIEGELDLATAPRLAEAVEELREVGWDVIVLDLAAADFVDATGLRLLLELDGRARCEGWRFALRGECGAFDRLLCVTGLRDWFTRA
jgi:anti-sigma B factor antagonist